MNRLFRNVKMIHVRKIVILQAILCALPIAFGFLLMLFLDSDIMRAAAFICGAVLTIAFLLPTAKNAFTITVLSDMLKRMEGDREFFVPSDAAMSRTEWQETVMERTNALRLLSEEIDGSTKKAPIFAGTKNTSSLGSDDLECFVFVYSTEDLDKETYLSLLSDAKKRIGKTPSRDEKKHKTRHFKISYGTAACAVVLADSVSEDVIPLCKETPEVRDGYLYPAVVDVKRNRVYMSGEKSSLGSDHDAQNMIGKLVFGTNGSIPREGGEHTTEYCELYDRLSKQTFGEFLDESKKTDDELKETERKLFEEMSEGEFRLDDGVLYFFTEGQLMSLPFFSADDQDETPITVDAKPGKRLTCEPLFLSWDQPKAKPVTDKEREIYLPRMIAYMESLGYQVEKEEEDA